ncbi:transporter substrate-binding domain-containing protein [Thermoflavimicrobium dichotomicum]|uniref:L-cystine transport system substrate-binding protein n=1 Tax=Thermoflavimicrobium dichotomicum TaxID=46223 RepID=A0A1I3U5T2_9BACL|nr:transporter substrate-binding domain-containing protein [Thermoflavimicrobium dichotomicum]SFJ77137.1 L-cystine transport system substrate-binding protein [Thermoflavimicrobium dichotomicum]
MKKMAILSTLFLILLNIAGCNLKSDESAANGKTEKVQKVIVGTGTQFPNICFIDKNGKLTGFDVELVREIDKRLPEYEFELKTMEFSNLLLSLQTKKIDFIAHQMEKNPDREARFLFNSEPYNIFPNKVVVHKNNNDIRSIDDLKGKKVIVSPTSNQAYIVEQYNKKHNNAINIVYTNGGDDIISQLKTGRADATISTQFAVDYNNKTVDAQQKTVGPVLTNSKVYFILRKDEKKLSDRIDQALKEIKADGTLSILSVKWLGADYSKETG